MMNTFSNFILKSRLKVEPPKVTGRYAKTKLVTAKHGASGDDGDSGESMSAQEKTTIRRRYTEYNISMFMRLPLLPGGCERPRAIFVHVAGALCRGAWVGLWG